MQEPYFAVSPTKIEVVFENLGYGKKGPGKKGPVKTVPVKTVLGKNGPGKKGPTGYKGVK